MFQESRIESSRYLGHAYSTMHPSNRLVPSANCAALFDFILYIDEQLYVDAQLCIRGQWTANTQTIGFTPWKMQSRISSERKPDKIYDVYIRRWIIFERNRYKTRNFFHNMKRHRSLSYYYQRRL